MKNLIKLGFIGLLMFTMVGCHSQKKEDPSIYPVMKEAFEYQQETGAEGCYQTVAIHDGHALTFYNDIWKSEGIQYDLNDCLRTDPVEIRVQSVTAIDGEQGIVMNLKKEEEQYIDDGYTSMPIVFVINNPFSSTLSTIFQRDVKGEIIGLDPNYSYEREGQVIKVTLKDPNEKSEQILESYDQGLNDVVDIQIQFNEMYFTLDQQNRLVSIRSVTKQTTIYGDNVERFDQEITITKENSILTQAQKKQIEALVQDVFQHSIE